MTSANPNAASAGLSATEAASRLIADGPNALPRAKRRSPLRIILNVLREPMLALLLAGGVVYLLLGSLPEVQECYVVTGDFDYVIKVVARDLKSLSQFLMDTLMGLPGVSNVRSSVCLDQIKSTGSLPLPR